MNRWMNKVIGKTINMKVDRWIKYLAVIFLKNFKKILMLQITGNIIQYPSVL